VAIEALPSHDAPVAVALALIDTLTELPAWGEILAVVAAFVWAVAVILFKRSDSAPPMGMNLFKNLVAIALLSLTMAALGIGFDTSRSAEDWARLTVSGLLGIALGDTLLFEALRRLGAGRMAVIDCTYAPLVVMQSVLFLGEPVTSALALGGALVVGGVLLATATRVSEPVAGGMRSVLIGATAILAMASGIVLAKPAIERGSLIEVTLIRLLAGTGAQLIWLWWFKAQRGAFAVLRPQRVWRTLLPASFLGTYFSMLLWLGSNKYANASVAAVLNQTSTVFIQLLARLVLRESISYRKGMGAALAIGGALVVAWR
jgi:drug/metabolite transporter (DMT)-like permease